MTSTTHQDPARTPELEDVRTRVRALLDEWQAAGRFTPACDSWLRSYDLDFSKAMGAAGLIGLSWPREYGGAEQSGLARLVVTEELLRSGAPVAAHWIADRQIGPSILRHGTDVARQRYLPGIAAGAVTFCLGMSETEAGSDLASVRTTATRTTGGWSITGRKIWTSQGHRSTHAYVLARTSKGETKHEGLSEFLVDMSAAGIEVRPIHDLRGEHHFNEITFDDVHVPDDDVLGEIGGGWSQVTDQLSLERGGIERVLSTYPLLAAAVDAGPAAGISDDAATGRILARLATLRAMAVEVAAAVDAGEAPVFQAAMLKDLGTGFENDVNDYARGHLDVEADPELEGPAGLLAQGVLAAPGFTIRGGTSEVLRTLVSRGVSGGRTASGTPHELREVVDDVLRDRGGDPADGVPEGWPLVVGLGWPGVGVPEEGGGSGGELADLAAIVEGLGRHAVSLPLAETAVAARALAAAGVAGAAEILTVAAGPADPVTAREGGDGLVLDGTCVRVPWASVADGILVAAELEDARTLVLVPRGSAGLTVGPHRNLAGEPRDSVSLTGVQVPASSVLTGVRTDDVVAELALLRAAALTGALETALVRSVEHVTTREQFGRPLIRFQAVATLVAELASLRETARVATERAVLAAAEGQPDWWARVAVARVAAGAAATAGSRIAHQLHAAMGVTREHPLHLSTRRLWSWRDEVGTEQQWAARLGAWLTTHDEESRWRWLTERPLTTDPNPSREEPR